MYKIIGADQKEYGPISAEVLRQWLAEGRVNASTKIQAEGAEGWKPLSQIPEFGLTTPPPLTPSLPPPPQAASTNNMAVWAFGVSLLSFCCCICQPWVGIISLVAMVLGVMALSQSKQYPNQTGKGFAIAAIIISVLSLILCAICILGAIFFPSISEFLKNGIPRQ